MNKLWKTLKTAQNLDFNKKILRFFVRIVTIFFFQQAVC